MNKVTKVLTLSDSDLLISFDNIRTQDICNNGNITYWVENAHGEIITSFWINKYDFKYWFSTKEDGRHHVYFTLKKKEVEDISW